MPLLPKHSRYAERRTSVFFVFAFGSAAGWTCAEVWLAWCERASASFLFLFVFLLFFFFFFFFFSFIAFSQRETFELVPRMNLFRLVPAAVATTLLASVVAVVRKQSKPKIGSAVVCVLAVYAGLYVAVSPMKFDLGVGQLRSEQMLQVLVCFMPHLLFFRLCRPCELCRFRWWQSVYSSTAVRPFAFTSTVIENITTLSGMLLGFSFFRSRVRCLQPADSQQSSVVHRPGPNAKFRVKRFRLRMPPGGLDGVNIGRGEHIKVDWGTFLILTFGCRLLW